ncbi:hypothetical protein J6590_100257 [Homalodisca vitripennis]|nr:hypothetical protein J6590_100257 [Homalodisca vitripennis]
MGGLSRYFFQPQTDKESMGRFQSFLASTCHCEHGSVLRIFVLAFACKNDQASNSQREQKSVLSLCFNLDLSK